MEQAITLPVPIRVPAWAWLVVLAAAALIYLMAIENGTALAADGATKIHEFFHDARHFVAVPCH